MAGSVLIPSSIGATALDVDYGDASRLPTPWASYRTQRLGGEHLYYGDDQARGNQDWEAAGCSGQVRGSAGYLILHKGGDANIARAMEAGRQMSLWPFPAELLGLHEAELIVPNPAKLHAVEPHGKASEKLEGRPSRRTWRECVSCRSSMGLQTTKGSRPKSMVPPCKGLRSRIELQATYSAQRA